MTMTEAQQNELLKDIREAVQEAVKATVAQADGHSCLYFTPEEAEEIGHYWGMVRDIGNGDRRRGVETMRENHLALLRLRAFGQKLRDHACLIIVGLLAAGLGTALWQGVKIMLQTKEAK